MLERADLVPIHSLDATDKVDWNPRPVEVSALKLRILEGFYAMAARRWKLAPPPALGPIAPPETLPVP